MIYIRTKLIVDTISQSKNGDEGQSDPIHVINGAKSITDKQNPPPKKKINKIK